MKFENVTTQSKNVLLEMQKKNYWNFKGSLYFIILIFLSCVMLLLFFVRGISYTNYLYVVLFGTFLILSIFLIIANPYLASNRVIKNEGITTVKMQFYDEYIFSINETTGTETKRFYKIFTKMIITKNLLLLISRTNLLMYIIDKRNFTYGSAEDFLEFMKEKCPNIKIER
ncbi:MAG TPA: YcxB family protein [Eubacteriales bacterium]|nr:YcxB family protein [Eubacteriales bacterium]